MSANKLLRTVNAFLCVLLVAFAVVQYNDPDSYFWIPVYLLPAAIAGMAAYRPRRLIAPPLGVLMLVCVIAAIAGTVWFWPTEALFWRRDVWWESETAREGMGLMIVTVSLLLAGLGAWLDRPGDSAASP